MPTYASVPNISFSAFLLIQHSYFLPSDAKAPPAKTKEKINSSTPISNQKSGNAEVPKKHVKKIIPENKSKQTMYTT